MVPKVPVTAAGKADVRAERDESSARLEASEGLLECFSERGLVREMFEKVAGENDVQFAIGQRPRSRAILLNKLNVGREMFQGVRILIHPKFFFCYDGVDELAIAATKVEQGAVVRNQALKEIADQYLPYATAILLDWPEALGINFRQFVGRRAIHEVFCSRRN